MKTIVTLFLLVITASLSAQSDTSKPYGKVWGYAFGDYFYKAGGDSTGTQLEYTRFRKDYNAFAFRRIFIGYDFIINKNFDTRLVLAYEGVDTLSDGNRSVFVKDAYIAWRNIFANSDFTFGI